MTPKPPIVFGNLLPKGDADSMLFRLTNELEWVRRDQTPRLEYYVDRFNRPYTYGKGLGVRTYEAQPMHEVIDQILLRVYAKMLMLSMPLSWVYEACFLNRYLNQRDWLGWHADDSPELDDDRPIAIVSLGAERNIQFKPQGATDTEYTTTQLLTHGSFCLMQPRMQETWLHRIPKCGHAVGERISLTFRGVHPPKEPTV